MLIGGVFTSPASHLNGLLTAPQYVRPDIRASFFYGGHVRNGPFAHPVIPRINFGCRTLVYLDPDKLSGALSDYEASAVIVEEQEASPACSPTPISEKRRARAGHSEKLLNQNSGKTEKRERFGLVGAQKEKKQGLLPLSVKNRENGHAAQVAVFQRVA